MIRILCLHGYRQNKELFAKSAASLANKLKKIVVFEYINSPYLIGENEIGYEAGVDRRKWWSLQSKGELFEPIHYDLMNDATQYVADYYNSKQFDGILGFSQGSVVVQFLLLKKMIKPKFAILIGTFPITDPDWAHIEFKVDVPLLFCIGERDELVPEAKTRELLDKLTVPFQICKYTGGHYVPSNSDAIKEITDFIVTFR